MPITELGDDYDGIETSVFGEGEWDDFQSLSESPNAHGLHSLEGTSILL